MGGRVGGLGSVPDGSGGGVILFLSTGSPNAFGRFVYFFQVLVCPTGPGGFGLVLPRPTGLVDFFKYWFAQRVWGFHFFSSTGLPNGPGGGLA